jgi:hypothetical protein
MIQPKPEISDGSSNKSVQNSGTGSDDGLTAKSGENFTIKKEPLLDS